MLSLLEVHRACLIVCLGVCLLLGQRNLLAFAAADDFSMQSNEFAGSRRGQSPSNWDQG